MDYGDLGPNTAAILRATKRWESVRMFSCDAEFETLSANALQWIDERVDEHFGALNAIAGKDAQLSKPAWKAIQSSRELLRLVEETKGQTNDLSYWALRSAIKRAQWEDLARSERPAWISHVRLAASVACTRSMERSLRPESFARAGLHNFPGLASDRPSLLRNTLMFEALWIARYGENPTPPSPWSPIISLWERGASIFLDPHDRWYVFVPVREELEDRAGENDESEPLRWTAVEDELGRGSILRPYTPPTLPLEPPEPIRGNLGPLPPPELPSEE